MSWYKRTAVWSVLISAFAVLISFVAIVLSQVPPIREWIPQTHVTTELGNYVGLPLTVGIPNYQILVRLENAGNRTVTISNIQLRVIHPNAKEQELKALSYFYSGESQQYEPTSIKLKAGETWEGLVIFQRSLTPDEQETINRLRLDIAHSIFLRNRTENTTASEADPASVEQAVKFFNEEFELSKGQYKALLTSENNGKRETLKEITFALYDYQINTLRSQAEDYKYDLGVSGSAAEQRQVWAVISSDQRGADSLNH